MARRDRKQNTNAASREKRGSVGPVAGLRIIGGRFRGRKLHYSGDLRTRPMKDRLREAIFNLIGPAIRGKHAVDLFAGTGALALEALSRGADRATLIEQHHPTADIIRQNIVALGVEQQAEVIAGNVFIWWKMTKGRWSHAHACRGYVDWIPPIPPATPADQPWVMFCSPPYDFYIDRADEMLELIAGLIRTAHRCA